MTVFCFQDKSREKNRIYWFLIFLFRFFIKKKMIKVYTDSFIEKIFPKNWSPSRAEEDKTVTNLAKLKYRV